MAADFVTWALDQLGGKVTPLQAWVVLVFGALLLIGGGIGGFVSIFKVFKRRRLGVNHIPSVYIEQSSPVNSPAVVGDHNVVTVGETSPRATTQHLQTSRGEDGYSHEWLLKLESPYVVQKLVVTALAPSIQRLYIFPTSGGVMTVRERKEKKGGRQLELVNASGEYTIQVITETNDAVRVEAVIQ